MPQPFEVDDGLRAAVAERLAAVGGAFEGAHFVRAAGQSDGLRGGKFDFEGCWEKDIESIGDIYRRYSDKPPNTYLFLFNGRLQFQSGGVFEKYFYIGLFDADKSFDAGLL